MSRFASIGRGRIYAELTVAEAQMLDGLAGQLVELLGEGLPVTDLDLDPLSELFRANPPVDPPDDPVLRRLLPDGRPDDSEASAEFRRFTESDLRRGKIRHAMVVHENLEAALADYADSGVDDPTAAVVEIELNEDTARDWMRTITDIRLAIAERLEITQGDEEHWLTLDPEDPQVVVYHVYGWLALVLESIVEAID